MHQKSLYITHPINVSCTRQLRLQFICVDFSSALILNFSKFDFF